MYTKFSRNSSSAAFLHQHVWKNTTSCLYRWSVRVPAVCTKVKLNWKQEPLLRNKLLFPQVSFVINMVDVMSWAAVSPDQLQQCPIYSCHWLSITHWEPYCCYTTGRDTGKITDHLVCQERVAQLKPLQLFGFNPSLRDMSQCTKCM